PTRGFSAEFGTALTVILGSKLGLPISTTHVLVGAVIGVGLARGMAAINLEVVKSVLKSWVITVPFTAVLSWFLYTSARFLLG
ncbi:inorganic phosphate transporter, partial [Myxococcota bacterium]|nr:inorganic phosphate transporter [Myxococcota bacterium]